MRTKLLLLLLLISVISNGQTTVDKLKTEYETELSTYCTVNGKSTKMISERVFDTQIRSIFNNVIIGNGDATATGRAFAFSNDKFKNTFTLNTNFFPIKKSNLLVDLGLNLTSKDNTYYYYTNKAWVNDIGIKAGVSFQVFNASQYINQTDGTPLNCSQLNDKRLLSLTDKFIKYDSIYKYHAEIDARIAKIEKLLSPNKIVFEDNNNKTNLLKELKKLKAQKDIYSKKLDPAVANDASIKKTMEADMDEFDKGGSYFSGHKICWVSITTNTTNASFTIANQDIINEDLQKKYKSVIKVSLEANINQQRDRVNYIETMQGFFKFNRGSLLDNPMLKGKKFSLVSSPDNLYYIEDESSIVIDEYKNLKRPYLSGDIGGYYSNVFLLKKTVGLIGKFSYNFPIKNSTMKDYETNYTTSLGLILRVNKKDKWSAATVILTSGFDSATFHEGANDKFFVKISAGIPFNVFSSK